jgi:hypothetical protein
VNQVTVEVGSLGEGTGERGTNSLGQWCCLPELVRLARGEGHVLAAAGVGGVVIIVTDNLGRFASGLFAPPGAPSEAPQNLRGFTKAGPEQAT